MHPVAHFKIKSVTHKFLVTGHNENGGDNVHLVIEKAVKRHKNVELYMFLRNKFQSLIEQKKNGVTYNVDELTHEDIFI